MSELEPRAQGRRQQKCNLIRLANKVCATGSTTWTSSGELMLALSAQGPPQMLLVAIFASSGG